MQLMERNVEVFDHRRVSGGYERNYGQDARFLDLGEELAIQVAAEAMRGAPVLDVGAGTGRLAPLLRLLSAEYSAIDYAPNMVEGFRRCHPGVDVALGDARDLSRFESGTFGLVVFSNNGIDTVTHDDRLVVLREFARVLTPSGRIVFSSLNRNGMSYGESPFQLHRPGQPRSMRALATTAARRVYRPLSLPRSVRNWRQAKPLAEDHGTWAVGALAVHDFAPFVHFTTLTDLRATVAAAGLVIEQIFDEAGGSIALDATESNADYFTLVARYSHVE
ncbi:MAG: Methylase [Ilumatobacteraceae bacterium]|nr:Methylase [Ilumatobacteraceae bacterium]